LNNQRFKIRWMILFLVFGLLQACDSGSASGTEPLSPIASCWEGATPDFSHDDDRPVVTIVGDKVVVLSI
jgi:hypothetical protein